MHDNFLIGFAFQLIGYKSVKKVVVVSSIPLGAAFMVTKTLKGLLQKKQQLERNWPISRRASELMTII